MVGAMVVHVSGILVAECRRLCSGRYLLSVPDDQAHPFHYRWSLVVCIIRAFLGADVGWQLAASWPRTGTGCDGFIGIPPVNTRLHRMFGKIPLHASW